MFIVNTHSVDLFSLVLNRSTFTTVSTYPSLSTYRSLFHRYRIIISVLPFFGFGSFMVDGMGVSCTFNYLDTSRANVIFVCFIILCGFVGERLTHCSSSS